MTRDQQRQTLMAALRDRYGPGVEDASLEIQCWGCPACGAGDDLYRPLAVSLNGRDPLAWCDECGIDHTKLLATLGVQPVWGSTDPHGRYHGRILDVAAMLAAPREPIPWRCENIAADGYLTVLAGRGKEGKTFLAMALACGVDRGQAAAGIPCAKGRAVIFDAENGPPLIKERFHAIGVTADMNVQPVDCGGLRVTTDLPWFRKVIEDQNANLVVFDSLRVLSSGSKESDGDEMEPIITALKLLARETGAAIILVHHRGKSETNDYRGSSVILDQADMLFTLGRVNGDPDGKHRRKIETIGCRVAEEPDPRWVRIEPDRSRGLVFVNEAEPYEEEDAPRARDQHREQVLELLGGIARSERNIAKASGLPRTTVQRILNDLEAAGLAERKPDGWVAQVAHPLGNGPVGHPLARIVQ